MPEELERNIKDLPAWERLFKKIIWKQLGSADYCMDATIKSGFEKGFNIFVPEYTNSTYDNPYFDKETAYRYFNEFMWNKRYAKVITVEQAVKLLQAQRL